MPMHPLTSRDDTDPEPTGGLGGGSREAPPPGRIDAQPSEADLVYAREAAADVLAKNGKGSSVPWENPNTGAGGNITPLELYSEGRQSCRDFLASYVHGGSQDWLQGSACRTASGAWEVRSLKPLKRA
jgi:surface antigen